MMIKKLLFTASVSFSSYAALAETEANTVQNLNVEQPKPVASVELPKIEGFIVAF